MSETHRTYRRSHGGAEPWLAASFRCSASGIMPQRTDLDPNTNAAYSAFSAARPAAGTVGGPEGRRCEMQRSGILPAPVAAAATPRQLRRFAVNLEPAAGTPLHDHLSSTIRRLGVECGSEPFAPHVTLAEAVGVPAEHVVQAAGRFAQSCADAGVELQINLGEAALGTDFFQCIMVDVEPTAQRAYLAASHATLSVPTLSVCLATSERGSAACTQWSMPTGRLPHSCRPPLIV